MDEVRDRILRLKSEKDVIILSHYYMPEELQWHTSDGGVIDFVGDSLGLCLEAVKAKEKNIVFCGVKFMAETALLVNPEKRVYMPDLNTDCSLASSIEARQIRKLKEAFPNIPVMGYINTYAETKAELDICCTSRNAVTVAASLGSDTIFFVPDYYMGQNLQQILWRELNKELVLWRGSCEVHEQFKEILREDVEIKDAEFLFHWEVPNETTRSALNMHKGVIGSTSDILDYVKKSQASRFYLASECDLVVSLKKSNKEKEFITPCLHCKYMKQNSIQKLLSVLEVIGESSSNLYEIQIPESLANKARLPVLKMLEII